MKIKDIRPDYWANFELHNFAAYIVEGALFKNEYLPIFTEGCLSKLKQACFFNFEIKELINSCWEKIEDEDESMACYALQDTAILFAVWTWFIYLISTKQLLYTYRVGANILKRHWQNSLIYPESVSVRSFHDAARQIIALKSHIQRDKPTKAHFIQLFGTYLYAYEHNMHYKSAVNSHYNSLSNDFQRTEFTDQINQAIDILQDLEQLGIPTATQIEQPQIPHAASDGAQGEMPIFYE